MTALNDIAVVAAAILLIELLVFLLIFLGVAGGLAFGLHWVRGKADWAFGKAAHFAQLGAGYIHTGTDYAAKPVILVAGFAETVEGTAEALRRRVREVQATMHMPQPVASRPVPPPDETVVQPLSGSEADTLLTT